MTAFLLGLLAGLLVGAVLGCRVRGRRRYNAGVAAGRASECLEHGWVQDQFVTPKPRRRFLLRSDRQPDPLVTRGGVQRTDRPVFYR